MKYIFLFFILFSCNESKNTNDSSNTVAKEDNTIENVSTSIAINNKLVNEISRISVKDNFDQALSPEITQKLLNSLENKSIVYLGESDHYFHEKFLYRLRFIEALAEQGYTNIYAELGYADGVMVNKYLESGDEDYLKQVGLYGFSYGRELKYSNRNFVKEVVNYLRKLRDLKIKYPKLQYHGFDLDMNPGTAYVFFDQYLKKRRIKSSGQSRIEKIYTLLERSKKVEGKRIERYEKQLAYMNKVYSIAIKILDIDKDFLFHIKQFKNSLEYLIIDSKTQNTDEIFEALQWREDKMVEVMLQHESKNYFEDKSIFLGHNGHLTKTDASNSNNETYSGWNVIGTWINKRYPDQVYAIWSFIGTGEHSGHGCPNGKRCEIPLFPLSLEKIIYENIESSQPLFFENSSVLKSLENEIKTVVNGQYLVGGKYSEYLDAFYFMPVVKDVNYLNL